MPEYSSPDILERSNICFSRVVSIKTSRGVTFIFLIRILSSSSVQSTDGPLSSGLRISSNFGVLCTIKPSTPKRVPSSNEKERIRSSPVSIVIKFTASILMSLLLCNKLYEQSPSSSILHRNCISDRIILIAHFSTVQVYSFPVFRYSSTYTLMALRIIQSIVTLLSLAIWIIASINSLSIAGMPDDCG